MECNPKTLNPKPQTLNLAVGLGALGFLRMRSVRPGALSKKMRPCGHPKRGPRYQMFIVYCLGFRA